MFGQSNFRLLNGVKKQNISFQVLNNLIVFPLDLNGKELNFILDSGVGATILFNIHKNDSVTLLNSEKIKLQGLGSEEPIDAILSKKNKFGFKNGVGLNQNVYVIFDDNFDLSSKLGITVHGIIGYEILKDFIITINYSTKKIEFASPENFVPKKCKKCETFPLEFYKLKPYINVGAKFDWESNKITTVKLLIDSGGSDALWFFENSIPEITPPVKYFNDILGEGLSGTIHGKRAYVKSLHIGNFEIIKPTVAYPDSLSISFARQFESRNGSLGATILRRFLVIFNYPNQEITLKKASGFKDLFRYNRSGLDLIYNGKLLVMEQDNDNVKLNDIGDPAFKKTITLAYNYKYTFKPSYKIFNIKEGSPAYKSGLRKGDLVIKINGKFTYDLKLEELNDYFFQKELKRINLVIERDGKNYEYQFRLEDILK